MHRKGTILPSGPPSFCPVTPVCSSPLAEKIGWQGLDQPAQQRHDNRMAQPLNPSRQGVVSKHDQEALHPEADLPAVLVGILASLLSRFRIKHLDDCMQQSPWHL